LGFQLLPKIQTSHCVSHSGVFAAFRLRLICSPHAFWSDFVLRKGDGKRDFQPVVFLFLFFEEVAVMPQGKIKKLIMDKGFGFIEGEREELFFHHSALAGVTIEELREGQQVEYDEGRGPKGPRAENVRLMV